MQNQDIAPVMFKAIEIIGQRFGGVDVKLLSTKMYRLKADEFAKAGRLGVDISINGIKTFLGCESMAEEIVFNHMGESIADDFVYEVLNA